MKTLIVYSTNHGCAEKCAVKLKNALKGETELLNLKNSVLTDLKNYETIIIGGSIHAGQIQKKVKEFCRDNFNILIGKKTGLFICCMKEGEEASEQFRKAFPGELIEHSSAGGIFGGEFNFEKLNFILKFIVKKVAKTDKSISKINEENIAGFVNKLNAID